MFNIPSGFTSDYGQIGYKFLVNIGQALKDNRLKGVLQLQEGSCTITVLNSSNLSAKALTSLLPSHSPQIREIFTSSCLMRETLPSYSPWKIVIHDEKRDENNNLIVSMAYEVDGNRKENTSMIPASTQYINREKNECAHSPFIPAPRVIVNSIITQYTVSIFKFITSSFRLIFLRMANDLNLIPHSIEPVRIAHFPKEILQFIFFDSQLSFEDLRAISLVCKNWRTYVTDSSIWERYNVFTKRIFSAPLATPVIVQSQKGLIPPLVPLFRSLNKSQLSDDIKSLLMTIEHNIFLQESFFRVIKLVQSQKRSDSLRFDNLAQFVQELDKRLKISKSSIQDFLFFMDELFELKRQCEVSNQQIVDLNKTRPDAVNFERKQRKSLIENFKRALEDLTKQDSTQKKSAVLPHLLRLPLEIFYQRQITNEEMTQWITLYQQSKIIRLDALSILSESSPFYFIAGMVLAIHLASAYWNTKLQVSVKDDGTISKLTIASGHVLNQNETWLIEGFLTSNEMHAKLPHWCSAFRFDPVIPENLCWSRRHNNQMDDTTMELHLNGKVTGYYDYDRRPQFDNLMRAIQGLSSLLTDVIPSLVTGGLIKVEKATILHAIENNEDLIQLYKIALGKLVRNVPSGQAP